MICVLESYSILLLFPVSHLTHALMRSFTSTSFVLVSTFTIYSTIYLPLILFYAIYLVSLVYNEVACMSTVDLLLFSEGKMSHRRTWRELQRKRDVVNISYSICCLRSFLSSCCQPLISLCPHQCIHHRISPSIYFDPSLSSVDSFVK